jgi:thioredoxin 1
MQYTGTKYLSAVVCIALMVSASWVRSAVPDIYPAPSRASADLAAALASAAVTHKRVIVDFGGNWCTDCHVLDSYFHNPINKPLLESNYILVHVNIGHMDVNVDIADRYQIPLKRGVPAVAVLDARGNLLYSQKTGEFEAMRRMQSEAVTDFLVHWKDPAS